MLYEIMSNQQRDDYKSYLSVIGSLSALFTKSATAPYLYYRAAETLFCNAFGAQDRSRSDVSVDATHKSFGIGLKTFLHGNGHTLQKIAEFNALRPDYERLCDMEIVRFIAEARNDRLRTTASLYGSEFLIYHLVTRLKQEFRIHETDMPFIDTNEIRSNQIKREKNVISFSDHIKEYRFNLSKSTLYQRFQLKDTALDIFEVRILDNPMELLQKLVDKMDATQTTLRGGIDFIYLPLYSDRDGNVPERSGLNQWNANGRPRHHDEVYIPVPRLIHKQFPGFLPNNNNHIFNIELPNGKILQAKLCQQGSKGLMSNPNKALGKWLLREVFRLNEGELVTNQTLARSGIDSVYIEKVNDNLYKIEFAGIGKYDEFKNNYCN
jgi:hypothetical protein